MTRTSFSLSPFRPLSPCRNVAQNAHTDERHHKGRSPITDEGEGESLCRKKSQDDPHVDQNLKANKAADPQGQITAVEILSLEGYVDAPRDQKPEKNDNHTDPEKTQLFSHDGEDEIRVRLRQVEEFLLAVSKSCPQNTS
jgi:hypothetical protein